MKRKKKGQTLEMGSLKENWVEETRRLMLVCALFALLLVLAAPLSAQTDNCSFATRQKELKMDTALLFIHNELSQPVQLYWLSDHCYQCLYQKLRTIPPRKERGKPSFAAITVDSRFPLTMLLNDTLDKRKFCRIHTHFGEFGNYSIRVKNFTDCNEEVACNMITNSAPVNSYLPILVAFLIYVGLFIIVCLGKFVMGLNPMRNLLYRVLNPLETERLINSELGSPSTSSEISSREPLFPERSSSFQRLRSLDTFRGISIVIMIFVNYGGGRYWFFKHESWNGLTLADLVFPWFVYIMGTSISLSLNSMLRRGQSKWKLLQKVIWRSILLFLIGILIINPKYCLGPCK
nr:PREDICTED: heparan-alpha-glucosaminide N-acetyltransferase-like [Latimeria chalumnae]|eukprot:XP_014353938.1 PREDICTED: heparan-alpha-glucosaminide N-acetyltransferase-like [Latimeria chalumnae]